VFGFIAASSNAAFSLGLADVDNNADINQTDIHDKVCD
jgi:hypothetical protein